MVVARTSRVVANTAIVQALANMRTSRMSAQVVSKGQANARVSSLRMYIAVGPPQVQNVTHGHRTTMSLGRR